MRFNNKKHTTYLGFAAVVAAAGSIILGSSICGCEALQINHKNSHHHHHDNDGDGDDDASAPHNDIIVGFEDSVRDNGDDEFHLMLEALSDARKKLALDDDVVVIEEEEEEERDLQGDSSSNTRYTANYIARFKYQLGSYCSGLKPIVGLGCGNGGTINFLQVNDPTISCVDSDGESLVCSNLCSDRTACEDIFVTTQYDDEIFGEIYFTCSGGDKASAGGIALIGPKTGECRTSASIYSDNFQFLHLRLGVFCFDVGIDGAYQFPSQFFECSDNSAPSRIPIDWEEDGQYNCIQGQSCEFSECDVDFEGLFVATNSDNVRDQCFTIDTVTTPIPIPPSPSPPASPPGDYSIRYQVSWSLANTWPCDTVLPEITINCGGNGAIQILETSHTEIDCSDEGDGQTIKCEETCFECDHFISSLWYDFPDVDEIGSVTFSCSGTSFDDIKATAEWPATTYECSSLIDSTLQYKVEHWLAIGPFCGSAILGGEFSLSERTAECDAGNDWNIDILETGNFYCMERELYFLRAVGDFDVSISSPVRVTANEFRDGCYTFVGAPTNPPTMGPNPTDPPTNPPTNSPPTNPPTNPPPPATKPPTAQQAPAPAPAVCEICPGDAPVTFPNNMFGTINCQTMQDLAREGSLYGGACTAAQNSVPPICGCGPERI